MGNPLSPKDAFVRLSLTGRIDSITSRETESIFREAVMSGRRFIVTDMSTVNYVSSAGLRVFISFQKELRKAGGEICLLNTTEQVYSVFEMSGFTRIFRFFSTEEEIEAFAEARKSVDKTREIATNRVTLHVHTRDRPVGTFTVIGNEEKLARASYDEKDVTTVSASTMPFATGLAALGHTFEDYKGYFGEAAVIGGNIFVYPALKRSAVDFIIHTEGTRDSAYHFLYGFSFNGRFNHVASFEPKGDFITLDELIDSTALATSADVLGITAIFESKGIFGMRLKKIPLIGAGPKDGTDIFSDNNFPEWVDYSIEPEDVYNLVVMTGIAVREIGSASYAEKVIPRNGRHHIHGVIFDKKPFNRTIDNFTHEVHRIVTKMAPDRVLHLLGKTRVGPGLIGIMELGG